MMFLGSCVSNAECQFVAPLELPLHQNRRLPEHWHDKEALKQSQAHEQGKSDG
jgi:hypothetical protein